MIRLSCIWKTKEKSKQKMPTRGGRNSSLKKETWYKADSVGPTLWPATKQNRLSSRIRSVSTLEGRFRQKQDPSTCEIIEHEGVRKVVGIVISVYRYMKWIQGKDVISFPQRPPMVAVVFHQRWSSTKGLNYQSVPDS
ncbi:hypothetical protein CR513_20303, partial [Mucuna pruriens]